MDNSDKNLQPELKDIINRIHAYNASHREGCFIFRFVGYKDDLENKCECGQHCIKYNENKSLIGAYGDLNTLRTILNEMRDIVENEVEEDGFVNF